MWPGQETSVASRILANVPQAEVTEAFEPCPLAALGSPRTTCEQARGSHRGDSRPHEEERIPMGWQSVKQRCGSEAVLDQLASAEKHLTTDGGGSQPGPERAAGSTEL